MITRVIDRNFANMRLDRFLRKAFPDESLSVFFAVIRKKKVRVNGVVGKANQMLQEGDTVCIYENFKSVSEDERTLASSLQTRDENTTCHPELYETKNFSSQVELSSLGKAKRVEGSRSYIRNAFAFNGIGVCGQESDAWWL